MSIARRATQCIMENTWSHLGVENFALFRTGLALSTGVVSTGAMSYGIHLDKRVAERNPWIVRWVLSTLTGASAGLTAFLIAGSPVTVIAIPLSAGVTCLGKKLATASTTSSEKN